MAAQIQDKDTLFETLIAAAVDGIIVIDEKGTIEVYNDACRNLFGYGADEAIGRNVQMLMPLSYRQEHDTYLHNYHKTGEKKIIGIGREVVGQRKDGTTFPMYLSVGEGTLGGRTVFVGIIHDLTPQHRSRQRLAELQEELLHVSRLGEMTQMVAALAHELNQPLAAIANYVKAAERMLDSVDDPQTPKIKQLVDKAATQTARTSQIIRRLRDFIEKRKSVRATEDINVVLDEAMALAFVGAADANVTFQSRLAPDLPAVSMDKVQIQQVLVNLIRNAVEAMQEVETRQLIITTRLAGPDLVEVSVSDTGPGLAPEVANRLFQPFVTTKEKGMGIGLAICQSIVEAHNGRISGPRRTKRAA